MEGIPEILDKWLKKNKEIKPIRHSYHSSFIFLTNALTAFYMKYYLYSGLFVGLCISSILFHSITNSYTYYLDQVCIYLVVVYGAYLFYMKIIQFPIFVSLLILNCFLTTAYLFFYGATIQEYCYDKDKNIGELYHALFHLISSFGHHLITLCI